MSQSVRWWENRWYLATAILLSCLPMLWPEIPPLTDMPGHIGRYHVASALPYSADLQRHWVYEWALVGNLGVDLIVYALSPLMGAETAAKWTVAFIPLLTTAALAWLSYAAGGRVSPATLAAFPLTYSYAFVFGFVNFALASALAIGALGLWIQLGRAQKLLLRASLFVPISCIIWIAHSFGWGMLGIFAFGADYARLRSDGHSVAKAAFGSACTCLALIAPLFVMLSTPQSSTIIYHWVAKISFVLSLLRDRWQPFDVACAFLLFFALYVVVRTPTWRFDRTVGTAALLGAVTFVVFPYAIATGAYADMRLVAPVVAIIIVAIRPPEHMERLVAIAAAAFFALRIGAGTVSFIIAGQAHTKILEAVPHIPKGAALLVLADEHCGQQWSGDRYSHIAGIAIARRDVFENGQWTLDGQQLLRHRHPEAAPYANDPAQIVYTKGCPYRPTDPKLAIRDFNRDTFTHVWTIGPKPQRALAPDVQLHWSNGVSSIYKVGAQLPLSGPHSER